MITKDVLKRIHSKNFNEQIITINKLTEYGLDESDIDKLIEQGVFQEINEGIYGLPTFESLYNYGKYLLISETPSLAFYIFSKCYQLDPNNLEVCEYLFYLRTKENNGSKAYEMLEQMNNLDKNGTNLYNLYLYLSTYIMGAVTKNITNKLNMLELKDLIIDETKIDPLYETLEYNLEDVLELIGNVEDYQQLTDLQKQTLSELINKSKEKNIQLEGKLLKYAKEEKYHKIIQILGYWDKQGKIDTYYKNILILSKRIMEILRTNRMPRYKNTNSVIDKISWRIKNGHFKRALSLKRQIMNNEIEVDAEYILLEKINKLILSLKKQSRIVEYEKIKTGNEEIDDILKNLYLEDHKEYILLIKEYLKEINKEEYEYLILKLIRVCFYEGDRTYAKVSSTLLELSKDEYDYNITVYLQSFYNRIKRNQFEQAILYLDIIKNYSKELPDIISSLESDLSSSMQIYDKQCELIKEYLINSLNQMKDNNESIMILEELPHETRKIIYKLIKKIPELRGFGIGNEPKGVVLRYLNIKNYKKPYKTYITLIEKLQKTFSIGDYENCIIVGKQLLEEPTYGGHSYDLYEYVGLSYSYLDNKEEADKYLTIAKSLREELEIRREKKNKSQLIDIIEGTEFNENLDDDFGVTQIEDIAYYIGQEKMSLDIACKTFNLTDEQTLLVKLIYARDYYIEGIYPLGDKLLQEVEKSRNKTKKVRTLLNEIRTNKLFYKNRSNSHTRKRIIQKIND